MKRWYHRNALVVLGLIFVLVLGSLVAGCSKKPAPETDTTMTGSETPVEPAPKPVVPEEPTTPPVTTPDYPMMEPSEYGVADVFFGFDEYDLSDEAMATLARDARILKDAGATVLIAGHCDERGTVEYNLALGEKRANAVKDYLVSLGVPASQLRVTSYGESKPFALGHNEEAWAQNRRAHFQRP